MIRTRLASLALATGLGLFCGCLYVPERPLFPRLRGTACCNGGCETGCCNGGAEGPVLNGLEGVPPPPPPPEGMVPVPTVPPQRLVPMPQSTPMPYVPGQQ